MFWLFKVTKKLQLHPSLPIFRNAHLVPLGWVFCYDDAVNA
jgi:hypothetical protein